MSHSTVSRALRNSPLIPQKTTERIQRIARERGYSASAVARSLVTRKTHTIGVVVTSIADPFNGEVVEGLEAVANENGYSVILATSQTDPEREISLVRKFRERRVDGVIVASSRVGSMYAEMLGEMQIPIVLLNNQSPGHFAHAVTIDNVDGAFQAASHLIDLGHRRIGYIGDQFGLQSDAERLNGYRKALKRYGLPFDPVMVALGDGKSAGGREAAYRMLQAEHPTALFCYNDMSALGALEAASALQLNVPQDLSIVGFDDLFFAKYLRPALTTIRQPKKELGRRSMTQLIDLLSGKETTMTTLLQGELVARDSTAPPATRQSARERTRRPGPRSRA